MKPRLQASLGQQLVLTPQLRQAIRLLQMSGPELDAELAAAVESNPLLDWTEAGQDNGPAREDAGEPGGDRQEADVIPGDADRWAEGSGWRPNAESDGTERVAAAESLHDY